MASAPESETLAKNVSDSNGCYFVPSFTGLGAPYWNPYVRGTIVGLTRGVNKYHIVRATLESIAFQVSDVLGAMEADSGDHFSKLKVDGGASANNLLMQMQADIIDAQVVRPRSVESTSLGAAYLAGLAVGFWKDEAEIMKNMQTDRTFDPTMSETDRKNALTGWEKAVKAAMSYNGVQE